MRTFLFYFIYIFSFCRLSWSLFMHIKAKNTCVNTPQRKISFQINIWFDCFYSSYLWRYWSRSVDYCNAVLSKFKLQSYNCFHFRKDMNSLIPPAISWIVSLLSILKNGFSITQPTKADMPLNRKQSKLGSIGSKSYRNDFPLQEYLFWIVDIIQLLVHVHYTRIIK